MSNPVMPKTRFQSIVFTIITAWIMVYIMTVYNTVLATGEFYNHTFLVALASMWPEFVIITLCAYFISSHVARFLAFRVMKPTDRPIFIIFAIQTFTVVSQVALASIIGVWHAGGFNSQFIPTYLMTYCKNFIMAFPVQLLIAGPIARNIFRVIFGRQNRAEGEQKVEDEMLAAGPLPTEDNPNPESFNTLVDHPHAEVHKAK
jgi:hypothetical protein